MRIIKKYYIHDVDQFKDKLLCWCNKFDRVGYLDSNHVDKFINSKKEYNRYELLVGVDSVDELIPVNDSFSKLRDKLNDSPDWWFGYFGYDLKNEVESLSSDNLDRLEMPDMYFFRPRWVFALSDNHLEIHMHMMNNSSDKLDELFEEINNTTVNDVEISDIDKIFSRISKDDYIDSVKQLKAHIQRGDIYEINFCQEFYAERVVLDPLSTYRKLKSVSPTPYSCFCRFEDKYLLSATPERFIKKSGAKLISQPIKGTAPRGKTPEEDKEIMCRLFSDKKERAENIMIVDLVRNDLSRTAQKGSVEVEELCGIYSFPQVHQMISTVVSKLKEDIHFVDAIKLAFPMGSMTGAPKVRAMELIEEFESTRRGLYSGAVGYVTPEGDFDFNVVIRSVIYNASCKYLSFMVGGAITMQSIPQKEYEECLLKAGAIMKVLGCDFDSSKSFCSLP